MYVQERDAAGNWSASGEKTIVIDITPPCAPTVTGAGLINDATPTWSWTPCGGGNGQFRFKLDDADLTTGATQTTSTSYTPASPLSEASHTLYVQERDGVGNWSSSGSFAITIDITKPGKPSFTSATTSSPSGSSALTWVWQSGGDGNGKFRYRLDSGSWSADAAVTTYSASLAEGLHTLSIAEQDDAGNWSDSASYPIYVLPAPGNLKAELYTEKTGSGIELNWVNNAGEYDSVLVYRTLLCPKGEICRSTTDRIARLVRGTATFRDTRLDTCESYRYYVSAYKVHVGATASPSTEYILFGTPELCKGFIRLTEPILIKE